MKGAVLAVGDELLLGDVINTNAAWLGGRLAAAGVHVVASAAVGDDIELLARALRRSLDDADVVVLSGGLGPTSDDLTRDAVALVAGVPLERQPALVDQLRLRFAAYGFEMPEEVLCQADVPRGAEVLDNPAGTAPGLWLDIDGKVVVALPGPPHELQATAEAVLARLAALSGVVVTTRTLHVGGLGESTVAQRIEPIGLPAGVTLAYLAGGGTVRVRFTTSGPADVLDPVVAAAADVLGDAVWGFDGDALDVVVHALLRAAGQTVAVAESLTGGLVAAALARSPGSSEAFRGSLVCYATDLKHTLAGVAMATLNTDGAVAATTATELAHGARRRLGADWGIGVTGVAGPSEQEGHPVGTVHLAVVGPAGGFVRSMRLPGDRQRVRELAATACLDLLRRALQGRPASSGSVVLSAD